MLDPSLAAWLDQHAEPLDRGACDPDLIVPRLAAAGVFGVGVPVALGGSGGSTCEAMLTIAEVAQHSLTAAFVFWGQRAFIEYLLATPNAALRERLLARMLAGELAGATGLSNAMKYLSGIEGLQIQGRSEGAGVRLDGKLAWVTNLRKSGYVVACAVDRGVGRTASVFALPHDMPGLQRSDDLDLIGLRASDTAAIALRDVQVDEQWLLHADGPLFLRTVRPAFLALQCGLALGVASSALSHARTACGSARGELPGDIAARERELAIITRELSLGLAQRSFERGPVALFELRLQLTDLALAAVTLELAAAGGKAYLRAGSTGFARRWSEAAFLPIVTPSSQQLRAELARHHAQREKQFA